MTSLCLCLCQALTSTAARSSVSVFWYKHLRISVACGRPKLTCQMENLSAFGTWGVLISLAHVNKMFFLTHKVSGSLLQYVYRACSYCDDDENTIYWSALVKLELLISTFVDICIFSSSMNFECKSWTDKSDTSPRHRTLDRCCSGFGKDHGLG